MKVAIDLYTIQPGVGGSGGGVWSYSFNMLQAIDEKMKDLPISKKYEIYCFVNSKTTLKFNSIKIITIPYISRNFVVRILWVHIVLPILCLFKRIDVLHKLASEIPFITDSKIVVSVLDLVREYAANSLNKNDLSVYRRLHDLYFILITKRAINRSKKILVISKKIKVDLINIYHCDSQKVMVAYLGTQQTKNYFEKNKTIEEHKILYIAAFYPHKNHIAAIDGFNYLLDANPDFGKSIKLYFRGHKKNLEYFNQVMERINHSRWKDNFVFVDYNLNDTLETIYDGTILLNLSNYEGFGLPVIEAQSFGLPVVCSDIDVFREIAGDSVLFADNANPASVADQLKKLVVNKLEYERMSLLGSKNASNYTWEKMANIVLEAYSQAAK